MSNPTLRYKPNLLVEIRDQYNVSSAEAEKMMLFSLQVEKLCQLAEQDKRESNLKEEYYWTYQSGSDWVDKWFKGWSRATATRVAKLCEKHKLVVVANYNKFDYDTTPWYRPDYETFAIFRSLHPSYGEKGGSYGEKGGSYGEATIPKTPTKTPKELTTSELASIPVLDELNQQLAEVGINQEPGLTRLKNLPLTYVLQSLAEYKVAKEKGWVPKTWQDPAKVLCKLMMAQEDIARIIAESRPKPEAVHI